MTSDVQMADGRNYSLIMDTLLLPRPLSSFPLYATSPGISELIPCPLRPCVTPLTSIMPGLIHGQHPNPILVNEEKVLPHVEAVGM